MQAFDWVNHVDCLRHPFQMAGVETIWELHTFPVINSCANIHAQGFTMRKHSGSTSSDNPKLSAAFGCLATLSETASHVPTLLGWNFGFVTLSLSTFVTGLDKIVGDTYGYLWLLSQGFTILVAYSSVK